MLGKRTVARAFASVAIAFASLVAAAGAAHAGTITLAQCEATPGTEIKDHGAWVGCHGPGMGSSGIKIVG
jgi:invasion protein IalB